FEERGLWTLANLRAYDWPNASTVTSSVVACADTAKVNVDKLNRSARAVAGTMIHERAHGFCHRHRVNGRSENLCDFAYLAGDLTIVIDRYRANGSRPIRSEGRSCSALTNRLRQLGVIRRNS
ncbi:MAG TPA: hypothetical protein VE913_06350, partial [Longimicrobium sp.]|nr:hypothetical protein [Longimicrobium sp.]